MNDVRVPSKGCVLYHRCVRVKSAEVFVVEMLMDRHAAIPRCRARVSEAMSIARVGENGDRKMMC